MTVLRTKLLRQSKGEELPNQPQWLYRCILHQKSFLTPRLNNFNNRTSYEVQLIAARKFSEGFSLQYHNPGSLQPVPNPGDPHDIFAIGFGGRQKLSRRAASMSNITA
jgi:hypothetical protein